MGNRNNANVAEDQKEAVTIKSQFSIDKNSLDLEKYQENDQEKYYLKFNFSSREDWIITIYFWSTFYLNRNSENATLSVNTPTYINKEPMSYKFNGKCLSQMEGL